MREKTESKVNSKETGRPVHLETLVMRMRRRAAPGGKQAEEMGEEGLLGVLPERVLPPILTGKLGSSQP